MQIFDGDKVINKVTEALIECVEAYYEANNDYSFDDTENKQPKNFSWVSVDVDSGGFATDRVGSMSYVNNEQLKTAFLNWIGFMLTDEIIQLYRDGKLGNITFRIGPDLLSGTNQNEELGITLDV